MRVVSPAGVITTLAGSGAACATASCGDGGAATAAALTAANGVAIDTHGNVFIADGTAGLRKVDPLGVLSTVAPGKATGTLVSVAIGLDGTLYGATRSPDAIIAVDPTAGAVTTVVGTGTSGYNGDQDDLGGPQAGTDTQVNQPTGISVTLDHYLAFADTGNNLIRRYNIATQNMAEDLAGIIDANGNPQGGTTPDGKPADATLLTAPLAVAATNTADYLITDTGNHSVRYIGPYLDSDDDSAPPPQGQHEEPVCKPGATWCLSVVTGQWQGAHGGPRRRDAQAGRCHLRDRPQAGRRRRRRPAVPRDRPATAGRGRIHVDAGDREVRTGRPDEQLGIARAPAPPGNGGHQRGPGRPPLPV